MQLRSLRTALKLQKRTREPTLSVVDARDTDRPPSFVEIIDNRIRQRQKPDPKFFRPSMLAGCDRENVFHYVQAPANKESIDPRLQRIFDNGTAVGEWIQDKYLAHETEWYFVKEAKVDGIINGARVRGSTDGTLIHRRTGKRYGLEIKTKNNEMFMALTKADPDHVVQATLYAKLQNIRFITILYWNKDKQFLREYVIDTGKEVKSWEWIKKRCGELKAFVDQYEKNPGPKSLPVYNRKTCDPTNCRYAEHCRKMGAPIPRKLRKVA